MRNRRSGSTNRADVRFDGQTLKLLAGPGTGAMASTNGINIDGSGNVGIGTTAPDTRLSVNSSATNSQAVVAVSNSNQDTRLGLWSGFSAGANPPAIFYTHDLRFGTVAGANFATGAGFSEAMRITSNGNITQPIN